MVFPVPAYIGGGGGGTYGYGEADLEDGIFSGGSNKLALVASSSVSLLSCC